MKISISEAAEILTKSDLVALPTETVYGLAANALSDVAIQKIYDLKGRPLNNPLIIHVKNIDQASEFAYINDDAEKLINSFWPGPLTIVLKSKSKISKLAQAGLDTIAIRCPYNSHFLEILDLIDFPLAAPSANISNMISPTSFSDVESYFPHLPCVDGGSAIIGIESTIIDLSVEPRILRHGSITVEKLQEILSSDIKNYISNNIIAPGMMKKHYAPTCALYINQTCGGDDYYIINFHDSNLISKFSSNLSVDGYLEIAAKTLFKTLKLAEKIVSENNLKGIKIARIPNSGVGIAINDKLNRASS